MSSNVSNGERSGYRLEWQQQWAHKRPSEQKAVTRLSPHELELGMGHVNGTDRMTMELLHGDKTWRSTGLLTNGKYILMKNYHVPVQVLALSYQPPPMYKCLGS